MSIVKKFLLLIFLTFQIATEKIQTELTPFLQAPPINNLNSTFSVDIGVPSNNKPLSIKGPTSDVVSSVNDQSNKNNSKVELSKELTTQVQKEKTVVATISKTTVQKEQLEKVQFIVPQLKTIKIANNASGLAMRNISQVKKQQPKQDIKMTNSQQQMNKLKRQAIEEKKQREATPVISNKPLQISNNKNNSKQKHELNNIQEQTKLPLVAVVGKYDREITKSNGNSTMQSKESLYKQTAKIQQKQSKPKDKQQSFNQSLKVQIIELDSVKINDTIISTPQTNVPTNTTVQKNIQKTVEKKVLKQNENSTIKMEAKQTKVINSTQKKQKSNQIKIIPFEDDEETEQKQDKQTAKMVQPIKQSSKQQTQTKIQKSKNIQNENIKIHNPPTDKLQNTPTQRPQNITVKIESVAAQKKKNQHSTAKSKQTQTSQPIKVEKDKQKELTQLVDKPIQTIKESKKQKIINKTIISTSAQRKQVKNTEPQKQKQIKQELEVKNNEVKPQKQKKLNESKKQQEVKKIQLKNDVAVIQNIEVLNQGSTLTKDIPQYKQKSDKQQQKITRQKAIQTKQNQPSVKQDPKQKNQQQKQAILSNQFQEKYTVKTPGTIEKQQQTQVKQQNLEQLLSQIKQQISYKAKIQIIKHIQNEIKNKDEALKSISQKQQQKPQNLRLQSMQAESQKQKIMDKTTVTILIILTFIISIPIVRQIRSKENKIQPSIRKQSNDAKASGELQMQYSDMDNQTGFAIQQPTDQQQR